MGLVNRVVPPGEALAAARALAAEIAVHPQGCLRHDRASVLEQWDLGFEEALANELRHGMVPLASESEEGAARFVEGRGRHGSFE
jgi:enoyl-CoA hydratase